MTPNVYLNTVRLKKAEELLIVTSEPIENIAFSCGYRNYSHFYRQFMRQNGISPEQFRRNKQREQLISTRRPHSKKQSINYNLPDNSHVITGHKERFMTNTVYLSNFTATSDSERFALAMAYLKEHPYTTFVVEPGTYSITDARAREIQRATMAGEYGRNPEHIQFRPDFEYTRGIYFEGQKGTRVIAEGVTLVIDGFMEPISIRGCEDIEIKGFTVTHKRLPYSRGVVTEVTEPFGDAYRRESFIEFDEDCPIKEASPMVVKVWPYDTETKKKTRADHDIWARRYIDSRHIMLPFDNAGEILPGVEFYVGHTAHFRPAVLIENSKDVTLDSLTVNNQPGMGILGNRSENITLRGVRVVPIEGHNFSTNCDATHFSAVKGLLRIENCTFRGHGDDMTNVHTYYQKIVRIEGDKVCYMQEKTPDGTHAQTLDYPDVGDCLELYDVDSLNLVDTFTVTDVRPMPDEWMCRVELDHALPKNALGLILSNVTWVPKTEIVGCNISSHNARSLLIKSRDVLIEGNTITNVTGPAIVVSPEANWYEGVASRDVIIRGNRIIECAEKWYGDPAAIMLFTGAEHPSGQTLKNIVIEDNFIDCPRTPHGISARHVDGLTVKGNTIVSKGEPITVGECANVCIEADD